MVSKLAMEHEIALDNALDKATSYFEKVDLIIDYCMTEIDIHIGGDYEKRVQQGIDFLKEIDYPLGEAHITMAYAYKLWREYDLKQMQDYTAKAVELFEKLDSDRGRITAYFMRTFGALSIGNYDTAFHYAILAVKEAERLDGLKVQVDGTVSFRGWAYFMMGIMYFDISDHQNAVEYFEKALHIFEKLDHLFGQNRTKPALSSALIELARYDEAEMMLNEAIKGFTENYNEEGLSRAINDLGVLYFRTGRNKEAEQKFNEAYDIRINLKNKRGVNTTLLEYAEFKLAHNKPSEALELIKRAQELSVLNDAKPKQMRAHHLMYKAYRELGNVAEAFDNLEKYLALKDEVSSSETNHKLKLQESNFAAEKAEQLAELEKEKNKQLKAAHDEIAEKQQEITDSINYAKRIQYAILPSDSLFENHLEESFVLYKPKDIVAGDFYWMQVVENPDQNKVLLAAADCTGHGVPGAMVSVVCNNALNRSIREHSLYEPGLILDQTREIVIKELSRNQEDVKDGMDIALVSLENENNPDGEAILKFAGANNPLWVIREGEVEIEEYKPNKQPIGKFDYPQPFETQEIKLKKGDQFYLFSDGFADQFGGPKGKKFKASNLKKLFLSIAKESMQKQKEKVDKVFEDWKGDLEQLDDICVIGVRI
ncbi:tetratricopeptide repeat protein [Paracrocinitomix mangrovi]|uniref:tetratricopeptide repeat protein n=1 Tax=Paracrocinitomix mangrovi TaxID=2862509 RepID=UPI001C8D8446|nr:tetratricopeptide repeat protein [Paracrocinitomix mangrovi]UKN01159.1 tetratricopeptide repeat protein [Paracrocinitomix mangrovi]